MAAVITGSNCLEAWNNACLHLLAQPNCEEINLFVEINNPCDLTDLNLWIRDHNPRRVDPSADNVRHVINTIFPYKLRAFFGPRQDFYSRYEQVFIKAINKSWGTYFQRLISFGKGVASSQPNQLENAITALQGSSPQRFFITFHLTASNIEKNTRPLGGPCWQYGEVIKNGQGGLDLIAIYRNQDYFNKALGNFIGLSKLLEFICQETNYSPGKLIIHAIHGYSSQSSSKLRMLM